MTLNEIALAASKQPKCNKAKAMMIVKRGEFNEQDVIDLYSHFLPTITKPKTPEQWLAKVINKKDYRKWLHYIYSDGSRLIASDGHRIRMYFTSEYEVGHYSKEMVSLDLFFKQAASLDSLTNMESPKDAVTLGPVIDRLHNICAYEIGGLHFNKKYVDESLAFLPENDMFISMGKLVIQTETCKEIIAGITV